MITTRVVVSAWVEDKVVTAWVEDKRGWRLYGWIINLVNLAMKYKVLFPLFRHRCYTC